MKWIIHILADDILFSVDVEFILCEHHDFASDDNIFFFIESVKDSE